MTTIHVEIKNNTAQPGSIQINNLNLTPGIFDIMLDKATERSSWLFIVYSPEDIDRLCLRALRCPPDSLAIKNRLKKKDRLLHESIEWILQDPQYKNWQTGDNVCLLWIKGGAGKGKTMLSIGIIEELSRLQHESTIVTYFFCQNSDCELNTLRAIITGLILGLMNQQTTLRQSLRRRWDTINDRFEEDVTSWRTLWNIFMEMLEWCKCQRVYIIVDALDECQSDGIADFFKLIVRNGLDRPAKIKWMLTSRPLDDAARELLTGHEQVLVSLELNSKYVSEAVKTYIAYKVNELSLRHRYGETLKREVQTELTEKAEGTFLWVSLVCKQLERVCRDDALTTIQNLPLGLNPLYDRVLNQLNEGELDDVQRCMRLLKVMMLAYRPLGVEEVGSVTGLTDEEDAIRTSVNRCASFIRMQESKIEFVHQSARDYLAGEKGQSILDSYEHSGHDDIALSCLSQLSELNPNLLDLPRPDSTRETLETLKDEKRNFLLASVDYAATFWVQHLKDAKKSTVDNYLALAHLQDATRFLLRHYHTMANWPLQIYSSAIIFSPESSVMRRENKDKIPRWLRKLPPMEDTWTSLIQTLAGHSRDVNTVVFSPDGKQIASGSNDKTIKLWDATTGDLQRTLASHSKDVNTVVFSPDGKQIASGSDDKTIKLWDVTTGDLLKTLTGHSQLVCSVAFSPDCNQIASGSQDKTIKLWDATTGDLQKTLAGHSKDVKTVAFSPDGNQIASGSLDKTIKLWDATTGDVQKTLAGHSHWVHSVAFSPDGKQIVSGSRDKTVGLWDTTTGDLQKTLTGHSHWVHSVAFSPDGKQIVSGSRDGLIKLWDVKTGSFQKTLGARTSWLGFRYIRGYYSTTIEPRTYDAVFSVVFSPDGKHIASGFRERTIKLWDSTTGDLQKTPPGHASPVLLVAFSPDGKQIASVSSDKTVKIWDSTTGDLQKTLTGIDKYLKIPTYVHRAGIPQLFTKPLSRHVLEPLHGISLRNQWICYEGIPFLRLPIDFIPLCHDVLGDQITFGFKNGRVLIFDLDRTSLQSTLRISL
ncbi:G-protein beta WD- 40 repeats containing protein [Penicillium cataractarum]|uniref:G-protein beta WD- 40 repeats containing protein n=1 Tax=Penicillium cataractarum TaxID=2100454 RepID=A0A9W9SLM3_9EURO|nr:G-protein beta WD- 40 repeats containing protein [Penicillium cataractarum]KAJ5380537.1 G-protein beta WD- 40 repeats containing protein [Penicillium cataractarum]